MSDSPTIYDDPDNSTEYEYSDPDEMHRVRRLRQIHDARERFETVRLKAQEHADMGRIHQQQAERYTAQLALDYVRELEPILRRADTDLLRRAVDLGSYEVQTDGTDTTTVQSGTVTIRELLDAGGTIEVEYQYSAVNPDTRAKESYTETAEVTMSADTATRLVRLCDDFLESVMPSGIAEATEDEWEI